ncbi:DEAD/DEAH box helicase family protein [Burkholderia multivorans]|uniref:DEAD/DEAH box helicase family protein n=3 Tax=Burkholderia multivorans TaxID=87883 RepID=A0AAP2MNV9_9BURK|nr:DEAD/DEAH box helicase family protein [Burkholderia multivorans]MBU9357496.1 DEAD/DEAH box helicase family protein [Burkholderia multivorans]MBU9365685.1 DEAD/DEAH box helicase family protein [Burkholderia multivorans]
MNLNYISVPPGTGKTTAALHCIADHVRRGMNDEEVGYIFYAAPTVALLEQSYDTLKSMLGSDEMLFMAISDGKGGRTVADKIDGILKGSGRYTLPFVHGSVLFLTHSAFLGLRNNPKFAETTVFFDESRKWLAPPESVDLTKGGRETFDAMFESVQIAHNLYQMVPRTPDAPVRLRIDKLEKLHELTTRGRAKCFYTQVGANTNRPKLITVTLPSKPFEGFKEVYVLSADFTSSQMFHLFKHEGYDPINRTASFMEQWLPGGYGAALTAIERRYGSLTLVPLLDTKAMPSKYQAQSGVAVPVDCLTQFKGRMEAAHIGTPRLRELVAYRRHPHRFKTNVSGPEHKFLQQMDEMRCDPDLLGWLLRATEEVANTWWNKQGLAERGLLILNEDAKRSEPVSGFATLGLGMVEGRNDFQDCTVVAFHAAVNPEQSVANMLNTLLESTGYDSHEDYVTDKAIQSIGRGIIRNRSVDTPMLAIVPTTGLAERIKARMGDHPRLDLKPLKSLGSYTYWTYSRAVSIESAEDGLSAKHRYLAKPLNDQIQRAQVNRSKARLALQKAETEEKRAKAQAQLAKWDAKLSELIAQRDKVFDEAA